MRVAALVECKDQMLSKVVLKSGTLITGRWAGLFMDPENTDSGSHVELEESDGYLWRLDPASIEAVAQW